MIWEGIVYYEGEEYKYPNYRKRFKLKSREEFIFVFECGHRVTDNVFKDLIRVKTGVQVYEDNQLELF